MRMKRIAMGCFVLIISKIVRICHYIWFCGIGKDCLVLLQETGSSFHIRIDIALK